MCAILNGAIVYLLAATRDVIPSEMCAARVHSLPERERKKCGLIVARTHTHTHMRISSARAQLRICASFYFVPGRKRRRECTYMCDVSAAIAGMTDERD